ncbi:MAG: ribosome maturation factor RimM [Acidobacteriota bacterium]
MERATPDWSGLVAIGLVARAQGRRGEVAVNPLTDFPERFDDLSRVFIEGVEGEPVALFLEWVRWQGARPILKFQGVCEIGAAEGLAGRELRIPEHELVPLPEDCFYQYQLVGCGVWDSRSGYLGRVEDIMVTGGTDVLVVRDSSSRERLIPLCRQICRRIDAGEGRIETDAPEGLVSLNAH